MQAKSAADNEPRATRRLFTAIAHGHDRRIGSGNRSEAGFEERDVTD